MVLYRFLRIVGIAFALLLAAAINGALIPRPLFHGHRANAGSPGTEPVEILVLYNAIHTDIALPLNDKTRQRFSFLRGGGANNIDIDNPDAGYIIFGWGGRSFYLETPEWSDLKFRPVFRAFTFDRAVMHVDLALSSLRNRPGVARFRIDEVGLSRMTNFIDASFAKANAAALPIEGKSFGGTDRFYEANGIFNAFFGCTTWASAALREAGIRTGLWNPLPVSLRTSLALHN